MHIICASTAIDVPLSALCRRIRQLGPSCGMAAGRQAAALLQGLAFGMAVWLLLAAPGFLSAADATTRPPVAHASR